MTAPNSGGYDNPPASGITFRYNNWHRAPHVNAQGTGDVTGNPLLVKTSGWHAIAAYGGITAADFALTASSPGRRAGVWAGGYSDTDYLGISRSDPPDIGALVYAGSGAGTALTNGLPVTGLSGSPGTELHYYLTVPSTANNLSFQLSGGTGDADLYVRYAATHDTVNYNCRPYLDGNNETCTMPSATIGTWHVIVRGYMAFSGYRWSPVIPQVQLGW